MTNVNKCDINFITWNVKGMNNVIKRNKIFSHLRQLNADIAFLQETHILNSDVIKLRRSWGGQVFHSSFNAKGRGTAILIKKNISFTSEKVISDYLGCYVIVTGHLLDRQVILVNIYAPNFDDSNFFSKVFTSIPPADDYAFIIGGKIISFSSYAKKKELSKLRNISEAISRLDEQYAISPCPRLYKERVSLQSEYSLLSTAHEEKRLLKTRHAFYEFGDKASKLLALQSRQLNNSKMITHIKAPSGSMVHNLKEINNSFVHFYSTLYTSEYPNDSAILDSFFKKIDLPTINSDLYSDLGRPVTAAEVAQAIAAMQSSKAPGPDGFPIEFYKKFASLLGPLLVAVYNESFDTGTLPPTLTQASISLIPKEGKDPTR